MDLVCKICGKICKNHNSLTNHTNKSHGVSSKQYYQIYGTPEEKAGYSESKNNAEGEEGIDYVVCPFCGVRRKNLAKHMNSEHRLEFEEYKISHPDFKLLSEKSTETMKINSRKLWNNPEHPYLKKIQERRELKKKNQIVVERREKVSNIIFEILSTKGIHFLQRCIPVTYDYNGVVKSYKPEFFINQANLILEPARTGECNNEENLAKLAGAKLNHYNFEVVDSLEKLRKILVNYNLG